MAAGAPAAGAAGRERRHHPLHRPLAGSEPGGGMSTTILWYTTRAAGVVSLVLLTAVVLLGLTAAIRWQSAGWPRFLTIGFHRNLALMTLVFLAIHIVTAVVDPFTSLGWNAALIPFSSHYRTLWLGLGAVGLYLLVAILVTRLLPPLVGDREIGS